MHASHLSSSKGKVAASIAIPLASCCAFLTFEGPRCARRRCHVSYGSCLGSGRSGGFGPVVLSALTSTSSSIVLRRDNLPYGTVVATIRPSLIILVPRRGCILISAPFVSSALVDRRLTSISGT